MTPSPFPYSRSLSCGCKVNLFLKIKERLPSGYHALESLFIPLSAPADTLEINVFETDGPDGNIQVHCEASGIDPARNSLTKAYALYAKATGFTPDLSVHLEKGIPHGAGLGGGSADAACLLVFLQTLAAGTGRSALSETAFADLGRQVGADVPFFLLNKPALARGTGEILEPVDPPCSGMHLVLVCPDLTVSTAWAFALLDAARAKAEIAAPGVLTRNDLQASRPSFIHAWSLMPANDFEEVIFPAFPQLGKMRESLLRAGASLVSLSGSGASLFGLFADEEAAKEAAGQLPASGAKVFRHAL
jgi:4-diphosphocytidyl-2-C-methyl-D-erythritol kinase